MSAHRIEFEVELGSKLSVNDFRKQYQTMKEDAIKAIENNEPIEVGVKVVGKLDSDGAQISKKEIEKFTQTYEKAMNKALQVVSENIGKQMSDSLSQGISKELSSSLSKEVNAALKDQLDVLFGNFEKSFLDSFEKMQQNLVAKMTQNQVYLNLTQGIQVADKQDMKHIQAAVDKTTQGIIDMQEKANEEINHHKFRTKGDFYNAMLKKMDEIAEIQTKLQDLSHDLDDVDSFEKEIEVGITVKQKDNKTSSYNSTAIAELKEDQQKAGKEIAGLYQAYVDNQAELDKIEKEMKTKKNSASQAEYNALNEQAEAIRNNMDNIVRIVHQIDASKDSVSKVIKANKDPIFLDDFLSGFVKINTKDALKQQEKELEAQYKSQQASLRNYRNKNLDLWKELGLDGDQVDMDGNKIRSTFTINPVVNKQKALNDVKKVLRDIQDAIKNDPIEIDIMPKDMVYNDIATGIQQGFADIPLNIKINEEYIKEQLQGILGEVKPQEHEEKPKRKSKRKSKQDKPVEELKAEEGTLVSLETKIEDVEKALDAKTDAIVREEEQMRSSVGKEIAALTHLQNKLKDVAETISEMPGLALTGDMSGVNVIVNGNGANASSVSDKPLPSTGNFFNDIMNTELPDDLADMLDGAEGGFDVDVLADSLYDIGLGDGGAVLAGAVEKIQEGIVQTAAQNTVAMTDDLLAQINNQILPDDIQDMIDMASYDDDEYDSYLDQIAIAYGDAEGDDIDELLASLDSSAFYKAEKRKLTPAEIVRSLVGEVEKVDDQRIQQEDELIKLYENVADFRLAEFKTLNKVDEATGKPLQRRQQVRRRKGQKALEDKIKTYTYQDRKTAEGIAGTVSGITDEKERQKETRTLQGIKNLMDRLAETEKVRAETQQRINEEKEKEKSLSSDIAKLEKKFKKKGINSFEDAQNKGEAGLYQELTKKKEALIKTQNTIANSEKNLQRYEQRLENLPKQIQESKAQLKHVDSSKVTDQDLYRASETLTLAEFKAQQKYAEELRKEYFKIKPVLDKIETLRKAQSELETLHELEELENKLAASDTSDEADADGTKKTKKSVLSDSESKRYKELIDKRAENEKIIKDSASMETLVAELDKSREGLVHLAELTNENVIRLDRGIRGKKNVKKLQESAEEQKAIYLAQGDGEFSKYNKKYLASKETTGFGQSQGKDIDVKNIPVYRFYEKMKAYNQVYHEVSDLLDKESAEVLQGNTETKIAQQKNRLQQILQKKKALQQQFDEKSISKEKYATDKEQLDEKEVLVRKELKMYQSRLNVLNKYNKQELADKIATSDKLVQTLEEQLKDEEYLEEQINKLRHGGIRNDNALGEVKKERKERKELNDLYDGEIDQYKNGLLNQIQDLEQQRTAAQAVLDRLAEMRHQEETRIKRNPNEPSVYDTKEYQNLADHEREYQYTVEETTRQITKLNDVIADRSELTKQALGKEGADEYRNNARYIRETQTNIDNVNLDLREMCRLLEAIRIAKAKVAETGSMDDKLNLSKLVRQLEIVASRADWKPGAVLGYQRNYAQHADEETNTQKTTAYVPGQAYLSSTRATKESVAELDAIIAKEEETRQQIKKEIDQITESFEETVAKFQEGKGFTAELKTRRNQAQYTIDRLKDGKYQKGENAQNAPQRIAALEARIAEIDKAIAYQESDMGSKVYARFQATKKHKKDLQRRNQLEEKQRQSEARLRVYQQQRAEEEAARRQQNPTVEEMAVDSKETNKRFKAINSEHRKQAQEIKGQMGDLQAEYNQAQQEFEALQTKVREDNAQLEIVLAQKKSLIEEAAKTAVNVQNKQADNSLIKENIDPSQPTPIMETWKKENRKFDGVAYLEQELEASYRTLDTLASSVQKGKEQDAKDLEKMSALLTEILDYQDKRKIQTQEFKKPTHELTKAEREVAEETRKQKQAEYDKYLNNRRQLTELATKHNIPMQSFVETVKNGDGEEVELDNLLIKSETIIGNLQTIQTEIKGFEADKTSALDQYILGNRNTTHTDELTVEVDKLSKAQGLIQTITKKQGEIEKSWYGRDDKLQEVASLYDELKTLLSELGLSYDDIVTKQKKVDVAMGKSVLLDVLSSNKISKLLSTKQMRLAHDKTVDSRVQTYDQASSYINTNQPRMDDYNRRLQLPAGHEEALQYPTREALNQDIVNQLKQAFLQEKAYFDEFIQAYDANTTDIDLFVDELSEENHEHLVNMMRYLNDLKVLIGNTDQFKQTLADLGVTGYGKYGDPMYDAMSIAYDDAVDQYENTRQSNKNVRANDAVKSGQDFEKAREEVRVIERQIDENNQKLEQQRQAVHTARMNVVQAENELAKLESDRNSRVVNATGAQVQQQLSLVSNKYKTDNLFTEGLKGKVESMTDILPKAITDAENLSTEEVLKLYDGYQAIMKTNLDMLTEGSEETIQFLQNYLGDIIKRVKPKNVLTQKVKPEIQPKYSAADFSGKSEEFLTKKLAEAQEKAQGSGKRAADWQAKIPAIEEAIRLIQVERAEQEKLNDVLEQTVIQEQEIVETKEEATAADVSEQEHAKEILASYRTLDKRNFINDGDSELRDGMLSTMSDMLKNNSLDIRSLGKDDYRTLDSMRRFIQQYMIDSTNAYIQHLQNDNALFQNGGTVGFFGSLNERTFDRNEQAILEAQQTVEHWTGVLSGFNQALSPVAKAKPSERKSRQVAEQLPVDVASPITAKTTAQIEQETTALEQNTVNTNKNIEAKKAEIATHEELEQQIHDTMNATKVAIAEGSSVAIAGNVKVDTQQFTALTSGLTNMENVAKALLQVVTQIYAKIAHGANIAADAIYDVNAPVGQILGQMENLDGVIDSISFKMPKFGESLSSVIVGDVDVDKYVGIKEAIDAIHEAMNSTVQDAQGSELYALKELINSSDVKATYKQKIVPVVEEQDGKQVIVEDENGMPKTEVRQVVELATRFRDVNNEVVDLKYNYDLTTQTLTRADKVVAQVSNKFTQQEQAVKKAEAQLTYYTSKFDKLGVKFKTFHLDDFVTQEVVSKDGVKSIELVAKAGTEAEKVLSIMTDSTKKLVVKVLQDLDAIKTKFAKIKSANKEGVIDPKTFEATTADLNQMIEQFEVDMNAVNRNVNTSVEHTSRNMLKSWQQDLANQHAWLKNSNGDFRIDTSGLNQKGLDYLEQYQIELMSLQKLYEQLHSQGKNFTDAQVREWKSKMQDLAELKKLLYSNGAKDYVNGKGFTMEGKSVSRETFDQMTKSSQYARQVLSALAKEYAGVDIEVVKLSKDNTELTYIFRDNEKNLQTCKISMQDYGQTIRHTLVSSTKHVGLFTLAWESMKEKLVQITRYVSAYQIFYKVVNAVRSGVEIVKELDRAMTEMRKVSKDSEEALLSFAKASHKVAQEIGSTAATIQNSAADWMKGNLVSRCMVTYK